MVVTFLNYFLLEYEIATPKQVARVWAFEMDQCVNYSSGFVEKEIHLFAVYFLYACKIAVAVAVVVAVVAVEVGAEGLSEEAGCSIAVVSVSEVAGRPAAAAAAAAEDGRQVAFGIMKMMAMVLVVGAVKTDRQVGEVHTQTHLSTEFL